MLPYFLRAEGHARLGSPLHGVDGPTHVQDPVYVHSLNELWVASAAAGGLPINDDFNGSHQIGAGRFQLTQHHGRRWSAADGYLRPALARPNLTVCTGALVHRALLEGVRAVGVRYEQGGATADRPDRGRGTAQRRIDQLSATIDALRYRTRAAPARPRHRGRGGSVRRGAHRHDHPRRQGIWSTRNATDVLALPLTQEHVISSTRASLAR